MKAMTKGILALGSSLGAISAAHAQPSPAAAEEHSRDATSNPNAVTTASAQPGPVAAEEHSTDATGNQDATITITAQKRESRLETTPVTVNVVSGASLAEQGVREARDLRASVPGLTLNESPGGLTGVSMRGIGTSASNQLFEQSVGLFVDGIYNPRARQYRNAIFDVERIEVIKGSQGVLFGKNTSLGAINVISRAPGRTFGGYVAGGYEPEFNSWSVEGALDVPAGDTFAVRVAGFYSDEGGYVNNVTLGRNEPREQRWLMRGVARWTPSHVLSAQLKLQWGHSDAVGTPFEFLVPPNATTLPALGVLDNGANQYVKYESSQPFGDQYDRQNSFDSSLTLNFDLGNNFTLTSVSGYSNLRMGYGFDSDSTPAPLIYSTFAEHFRQGTQEVRLTSPSGRPIEFILGGFYQNQRVHFDLANRFQRFFGFLTGTVHNVIDQREEAFAGFGQVTWHITPRFRVDVGARLSQDTKTATWFKTVAGGLPAPAGTLSGRISDLTLDGTATLSYNLTDRSVLYASVGRGTKSGAFNNNATLFASTPSPFIVPQEQVVSYEAGIKGRFLDNRGYASLAVYHLDVKGFQDSFYSAAANGFIIRSVDATSDGVEGEARFQVAPWLNLFGNFAYAPTVRLASGERAQRSPEFTYVLGTRISAPLGATWRLDGNAQLVHSSSYFNQPPGAPGDNRSGTYDLLGARLAITYLPANLEFSINATNVTNSVYRMFTYGAPLGGTVGALNRPRTITLGVRARF